MAGKCIRQHRERPVAVLDLADQFLQLAHDEAVAADADDAGRRSGTTIAGLSGRQA